ncbi:hypothetical protein KFU94_07950 [Chloroflexi bacterium TSY]|nr:hypothetical protein [Chloroflexi bacterium TSY]
MGSDQRLTTSAHNTSIQQENTLLSDDQTGYQSRVRTLLGMPTTRVVSNSVQIPPFFPGAFPHKAEPFTVEPVPTDAQDQLVEAVFAREPSAMPATPPVGEPQPGEIAGPPLPVDIDLEPTITQSSAPVGGPRPKPPPRPNIEQDKAEAIVPDDAIQQTKQTSSPKLNDDPIQTFSALAPGLIKDDVAAAEGNEAHRQASQSAVPQSGSDKDTLSETSIVGAVHQASHEHDHRVAPAQVVPKLNDDPIPTRSTEPGTEDSNYLVGRETDPSPQPITNIPRSPVTGPGAKQEQADRKTVLAEEQLIEEINLVIPSLSEGKQTFSALAPDSIKDDVAARERNEDSRHAGQPAAQPHSGKASSLETTVKGPEHQTNHESAYEAAAQEAATIPAQSGIDKSETKGSGVSALVHEQRPDVNQPEPTPQRSVPAVTADDIGNERQLQALSASSASQVSAANVLQKVHSTRNLQVERLTKAVNELEAKVAAQAARLEEVSRSRSSQSSPPSTVVVNRTVKSAGTPRAYWSRSYLGRLHLKTRR